MLERKLPEFEERYATYTDPGNHGDQSVSPGIAMRLSHMRETDHDVIAPFVKGDYKFQYYDPLLSELLSQPVPNAADEGPMQPPTAEQSFDRSKVAVTQPLPPLTELSSSEVKTPSMLTRAGQAITNWFRQAGQDLVRPRKISDEEREANESLERNWNRQRESLGSMTAGDLLYGVGGTLNDLTDRVGDNIGRSIKGRVEDFKDPAKVARRRQDEVHARNAQAAARQQEEIVAGIRNSDGESYDPNTEYIVGVPGINPLGFDSDLRERAGHGEDLSALAEEQSRRQETPEQREERQQQEFLDWQEMQKKPRKEPENQASEISVASTLPGKGESPDNGNPTKESSNEVPGASEEESGSLSADTKDSDTPEYRYVKPDEVEVDGSTPDLDEDIPEESDQPQPPTEQHIIPSQDTNSNDGSQESSKQRRGWFGGKPKEQYVPAKDIVMDGSEVDDKPQQKIPQKKNNTPQQEHAAPNQEMFDDSYGQPRRPAEPSKTLEEKMQDLRDRLGNYAYKTPEGQAIQNEMRNRAYLEQQLGVRGKVPGKPTISSETSNPKTDKNWKDFGDFLDTLDKKD